jgi:hypothetical protein
MAFFLNFCWNTVKFAKKSRAAGGVPLPADGGSCLPANRFSLILPLKERTIVMTLYSTFPRGLKVEEDCQCMSLIARNFASEVLMQTLDSIRINASRKEDHA